MRRPRRIGVSPVVCRRLDGGEACLGQAPRYLIALGVLTLLARRDRHVEDLRTALEQGHPDRDGIEVVPAQFGASNPRSDPRRLLRKDDRIRADPGR